MAGCMWQSKRGMFELLKMESSLSDHCSIDMDILETDESTAARLHLVSVCANSLTSKGKADSCQVSFSADRIKFQ